MKNRICSLFVLVMVASISNTFGQVSIISVFVNPDHVVPSSLCDAGILNTSQRTFEVNYSAILTNSQNQLILKVKLPHISIKPGLNSISQFTSGVDQVLFGTGAQAEFVKARYMLPSGKFRICCEIVSLSGDEVNEDYCDEIEANFNSLLNLIYPYEGDTIYSYFPILIWNHNLPFDLSNSNAANYRIQVARIENGQTPEQALRLNQPLFKQDFLRSHNIQYPFGAGKLEEGGHYAWQVLEFDHALLNNKTEIWDFFLAREQFPVPNRYGVMKSSAEPGFYTVSGEMLYFKFDEEYHTNGKLDCLIYDSKRKVITPQVNKNIDKLQAPNIKNTGDNRYEINLASYHLRSGLYMLEVKNEKSQVYYLRFQITN